MRNIVFAVVAAATLGTFGTASAADLPARYPNATPPAPVILPVFSWTGCYLGGFAGGAWGNDLAAYDRSNLAGQPGPPFDAWSYKLSSSFIGGGTVGCNWQPVGTPFVAGVEGEFGYLKLSGSSFDPLDPIGPNNILSTTKIGDWYGMLTGRLGYAWDRALFYVKGGAAFVNAQNSVSDVVTGFTASTSNTEATWTLGGGLEWALDPNWSVKAEYMYVGLDKTLSDCGFLATSFCYDHNLRGISTAKVGLNYRFNGAAWLGLR